MKDALVRNTEIAAYFLWEYTKNSNAIVMWYCTEDICFFFERNDILAVDAIKRYTRMDKYDSEYIDFMRNISYRIYLITKQPDHIKNWFIAEKLISNPEWCTATANTAAIYRLIRDDDFTMPDSIRTEWIRRHLSV